MSIVSSAQKLIGNTPVLHASRAAKILGAPDTLYAKLEMMNPTLSAKDRAALSMIQDYEARSLLPPGGTIIEPKAATPESALPPSARSRATRSSSSCRTP